MGVRSIKRVLKISTMRDERQLVICSAIRQLRTIEFYYRGGIRTVEPFALGIVMSDRADNLSLLCYQTGGFSELMEVIGWKLYRVSEMEDLEVMREKFKGNRPGYAPDGLQMSQVICCVKPVAPTIEEIKEPPKEEAKVEVTPIPVPAPLPVVPPPTPAPEVKPQPVIRYLTHNELMERFRYAHPMSIPELDTTLWPEPLIVPFPEHVKSKIWPVTPDLGDNPHYLLGETS